MCTFLRCRCSALETSDDIHAYYKEIQLMGNDGNLDGVHEHGGVKKTFHFVVAPSSLPAMSSLQLTVLMIVTLLPSCTHQHCKCLLGSMMWRTTLLQTDLMCRA